jgi:plasmid maintenance system antidote protein VapI
LLRRNSRSCDGKQEEEMNEIELLDRAKEKMGSDYAVAKALKVSQQRINNVRRGANKLGPWMAGRLAELIGEDGPTAVFMAMAENARNPQEKKDWLRWGRIAGVIMTTGVISANTVVSSSYADEPSGQAIHYAQSTIYEE